VLQRWNILLSRWLYLVGPFVAVAGIFFAGLADGQGGKRLGLVVFALGASSATTVFSSRAQHNPYSETTRPSDQERNSYIEP
jgi:hypothetical protein